MSSIPETPKLRPQKPTEEMLINLYSPNVKPKSFKHPISEKRSTMKPK